MTTCLEPLQRVDAEAALSVGPEGLGRLYQRGAARLRFPRTRQADPRRQVIEAALVNVAGGLTGGDRFTCAADVLPGGSLTLTTPACEKIYRSADGMARVINRLAVAATGQADWLPQETILYDGAVLERDFNIDLEPGARLLALEALILGRQAMGEQLRRVDIVDRWRVRRGGRLIYADATIIEDPALLAGPAALAGATACATLLMAGSGLPALDAVRALLADGPASGGASLLAADVLLVRLVAADGAALRRVVGPLVVLGRGDRPLPRLWAM